MQHSELSIRKRIKLITLTVLSVIVILAAVNLILANRVVGHVEGNKLYYKSDIYRYIEIDDAPFAGFGMSLGKVDVDGVKCDLFPIKGQPQILHVSFVWDGREYRKE